MTDVSSHDLYAASRYPLNVFMATTSFCSTTKTRVSKTRRSNQVKEDGERRESTSGSSRYEKFYTIEDRYHG